MTETEENTFWTVKRTVVIKGENRVSRTKGTLLTIKKGICKTVEFSDSDKRDKNELVF